VRKGKGDGKDRIILFSACKTEFSERKGTIFWKSYLPHEITMSIAKHLKEGCGTRQTARLVEVDKDTVTRVGSDNVKGSQKPTL
jgi:LacI family transcriptional regulator